MDGSAGHTRDVRAPGTAPVVPGLAAQLTLDALIAETGRQLCAQLAVLRLPQFDLTITYDVAGGRYSSAPLRPSVRKLLAVAQLNDPALPMPATLEHGGPALATPIHDAERRPAGALCVVRSTETGPFSRTDAQALQSLATRVSTLLQRHHDGMTGVLNRTLYDARAADAFTRAAAESRPLGLLHVDVDLLHVTNERHGYEVGDEVLRLVARTLVTTAPTGALVARVAGDRFSILAEFDTADAAFALAARAAESIRTLELQVPSDRVPVSASIGVFFASPAVRPGEAQNRAQLACRVAKERGRGRAELYRSDDAGIARREEDLAVIGDVFRAVQHDEFLLMAQPIVALGSPGAAPQFEILLRMRRGGDLVPPGEFLGAAEHYHLMPAIDRWVVRHSLAMLHLHQSLIESTGARFSINLSGQSLGDPDFAEFLERQVHAHPALGPHLTFEITETAAVSRLQPALALMRRLGDLGCDFALDDFGAGASSFGYLRDLPVQKLKIDASFVRDLGADKVSEAMIRATREVAKTLGLTLVAEGVETETSRRALEAMSIGHAQGFLFGVPQPLHVVLQTTLPELADELARVRQAATAAATAPTPATS
jgi:diguanylate cyclase (GGDEF)-like protein